MDDGNKDAGMELEETDDGCACREGMPYRYKFITLLYSDSDRVVKGFE